MFALQMLDGLLKVDRGLVQGACQAAEFAASGAPDARAFVAVEPLHRRALQQITAV